MDRMIYTALTGVNALMRRQEVHANNLANASTPGFRAELLSLVPVEPANSGAGGRTRVYALDANVGADFTPGPIQRTGRGLDLAVSGSGWFAVNARDGGEAYTRSGSLQVSPAGELTTASGLPVLGDAGPITVPPDSELSIARDGTISVVQGPNNIQVLGRLKLVDPSERELKKGEDGLFRMTRGGEADRVENVTIVSGAVEGSNVNPVETMVGMIGAARQFEMQMKLLQTAEANSRSAGALLQSAG